MLVLKWNFWLFFVMFVIYYQKYDFCGMKKVWFADMYLHFMERNNDLINLTKITFYSIKISLLE